MSEDTDQPKRFAGTGRYSARLLIAPNRKNYDASMKCTLELYDGRNKEGTYEYENMSEIAGKIQEFLLDKMGHKLHERMLARWFMEYFDELGIKYPAISDIINDFGSTPQEKDAREGREPVSAPAPEPEEAAPEPAPEPEVEEEAAPEPAPEPEVEEEAAPEPEVEEPAPEAEPEEAAPEPEPEMAEPESPAPEELEAEKEAEDESEPEAESAEAETETE